MMVIVEQGQIRINTVSVAVEGPDFAVFEVNTRSKYPEVGFLSDGPDGLEVYLVANEHTLRAADTTRPTMLRFPNRGEWGVVTSTGRYTVAVALYRADGKRRPAWSAA